jgi:hypothetical protein
VYDAQDCSNRQASRRRVGLVKASDSAAAAAAVAAAEIYPSHSDPCEVLARWMMMRI